MHCSWVKAKLFRNDLLYFVPMKKSRGGIYCVKRDDFECCPNNNVQNIIWIYVSKRNNANSWFFSHLFVLFEMKDFNWKASVPSFHIFKTFNFDKTIKQFQAFGWNRLWNVSMVTACCFGCCYRDSSTDPLSVPKAVGQKLSDALLSPR